MTISILDQLRIYSAGFNDGFQRALTLISQAAERDAAQAAAALADRREASPRAAPANRTLTKGEEAALAFLRSHPGISAHRMRKRGRNGTALYQLAAKGYARKEGSRFYPAEELQ